jgi:hypothetical protein
VRQFALFISHVTAIAASALVGWGIIAGIIAIGPVVAEVANRIWDHSPWVFAGALASVLTYCFAIGIIDSLFP